MRVLLVMFIAVMGLNSELAIGQVPSTVTVSARSANLRSGPGVNYPNIGVVNQGASLSVLDRNGVWYLVQVPEELGTDARTAYIHSSIVSVSVDSQSLREDAESNPPVNNLLARPSDPFVADVSEELDTYELQRRWNDDQWREYERFEKSTFGAAGLEWLIPTLGHGYVDRASRGLTPALVSVGGLTLAVIGTQVGCSSEAFGSCINKGSTALIWTGILGYVGGRIWGIVSALDYAEEYNREVAKRISTR